MARQKKRVYSTKTLKAPIVEKIESQEHLDEIVEEIETALGDSQFTLDEAIEWFKKNPHEEQFWCPGTSGFAIAHGKHYLKFEKGKFLTSDPVEVEILMRSKEYNLHIFAINPVLRNLRK